MLLARISLYLHQYLLLLYSLPGLVAKPRHMTIMAKVFRFLMESLFKLLKAVWTMADCVYWQLCVSTLEKTFEVYLLTAI